MLSWDLGFEGFNVVLNGFVCQKDLEGFYVMIFVVVMGVYRVL